MKKKFLITTFIMFCIFFLNIKSVFADSLEITCNKTTLQVNETVACKITGTTSEVTRAVLGKLINSSNLEVSHVSNISPYDAFGELSADQSFIFFSDADVPAGQKNIFSFNITALTRGNATLSLRNYIGADNNLLGYNTSDRRDIQVEPSDYPIVITNGDDPEPPTPKSNDSSLASLVPEEGELDPGFTSDNLRYSMNIDFTMLRTLNFTAVTNHPAATVGETSCSLPDSTSVESVICNIQVTAEDSSKSTYKITVNNTAYVPTPTPSGDIFINNLTYDVDAVLSPVFKKDTYLYEMSVNFSNIHEINFTVQVDEGITVSGKKCTLPNGSNVESTICVINISKNDKNATYKITVNNTDRPDIKCDLIVRSNIYNIDQNRLIIKVNGEHSLETIKSNLYSTCGTIQVFNDKVIIVDGTNSREYKLEKLVMPKTGNNIIVYPLAILSVLAIIGIFIFVKNKYYKKEQ